MFEDLQYEQENKSKIDNRNKSTFKLHGWIRTTFCICLVKQEKKNVVSMTR